MYPHERALVKHLSDKSFVLIGVNSDDDVSIPQGLMEKGQIAWRSFQNQQDGFQISEKWGVRSWPTIYLIDPQGKIRYHNARGPALNKAIASLLEEAGETFPKAEIEASSKKEADREF